MRRRETGKEGSCEELPLCASNTLAPPPQPPTAPLPVTCPPAVPGTLRGNCPSEKGRRQSRARGPETLGRGPPETAPESKAQPGRAFSVPDAETLKLCPGCVWACAMSPVPRVTLVFVLSCQELQNALQQRLLHRPAGVLLAAEEEGVQQHRQRRGIGDPQVWGPQGGRRAGGQAPWAQGLERGGLP